MGSTFQGQGRLLHFGVLGFCIDHCFTYVVDRPLFFFFLCEETEQH